MGNWSVELGWVDQFHAGNNAGVWNDWLLGSGVYSRCDTASEFGALSVQQAPLLQGFEIRQPQTAVFFHHCASVAQFAQRA